MVSQDTKLVVKHHRPIREIVVAVVLLALLAWLAWSAFDFGRQRAGFDSERAHATIVQLAKRNEALLDENARLRERVAVLERSSLVDRSAYAEIEASLEKLQAENLELKQEIEFYQGIVSPKTVGHSVKVKSLRLERGAKERTYQFKLVLIQAAKVAKTEKGVAGLYLHDLQNGRFKEIAFRDLAVSRRGTRFSFKFKYFQNIEGTIVLPKDFSPERVVVKVDPAGKKKRQIEKIFEWAEVVS